MGPQLKFDHVGLRYGSRPEVLSDLSFSIPEGSFHFITGQSGAGKSSLLKLMYLAHPPSRGVFQMFGRDVLAMSRQDRTVLRRRIGVVFQDFRLLDHLSALDNVALPLRIAGAKESVIHEYVTQLLDWVGLGERKTARPHTLSGGEQQRVAIARAVIARPDLLLADEPTGNVDDEVAIRIMKLFVQLNRIGTTVIVATHNDSLISRFTYPVLTIEEGRVLREAEAAP